MAPLRASNLVTNEWCMLGGPTVKAANTRGLSEFFVLIAIEFYDSDTEYHRLVQRIARCLDRVYKILYGAGTFLTPAALGEFKRTLLMFGATFQALRGLAAAQNLLAWNITPKVHFAQHLGQQAALVNPRWCQSYTEESQIGSTTQVWSRSARGRYRKGVQRLVLMKRVVALAVRLEGVLGEV